MAAARGRERDKRERCGDELRSPGGRLVVRERRAARKRHVHRDRAGEGEGYPRDPARGLAGRSSSRQRARPLRRVGQLPSHGIPRPCPTVKRRDERRGQARILEGNRRPFGTVAISIANAIDGQPKTYWSIHPRYGEAHEAVFELKEPLGHDVGTTSDHPAGAQRKAGASTGPVPVELLHEALSAADQRAALPAALVELLRYAGSPKNARATPRTCSASARDTRSNDRIDALPLPRMVYAVARDFPSTGSFKPAITPRPIHLLMRGDLNKPGERVEPGSLACVQGLGAALAICQPERRIRPPRGAGPLAHRRPQCRSPGGAS